MGLSNSDNTRKTFINIINGKFAVGVKENTPDAVSRENKKGVKVWEKLYNTLSDVMIENIYKEIGDFGASWKVILKEADEEFILNLSYSGRTSNGFLHRLPNIDFSLPVTLQLHHFEETGKTYMSILQNGQKLEAAYTKENPNGLPQLEKIKLKGVDTWDDSKQMEFIEHMIETTIQPKLKGASVAKEEVAENEEDLSDSLPF